MPDVPGTGAVGLFQGPGEGGARDTPSVTGEPQGIQQLEQRGAALLLGMLSRLQRLEGILRIERIERISAEEIVRVTVIDNTEATARILELENDRQAIIFARDTAELALGEFTQNATAHIDAMTLHVFNEFGDFRDIQKLRDDFAVAVGISIATSLPR